MMTAFTSCWHKAKVNGINTLQVLQSSSLQGTATSHTTTGTHMPYEITQVLLATWQR